MAVPTQPDVHVHLQMCRDLREALHILLETVLHPGIILLFAVGNTLPAFLDMCIDEAAKKMMA